MGADKYRPGLKVVVVVDADHVESWVPHAINVFRALEGIDVLGWQGTRTVPANSPAVRTFRKAGRILKLADDARIATPVAMAGLPAISGQVADEADLAICLTSGRPKIRSPEAWAFGGAGGPWGDRGLLGFHEMEVGSPSLRTGLWRLADQPHLDEPMLWMHTAISQRSLRTTQERAKAHVGGLVRRALAGRLAEGTESPAGDGRPVAGSPQFLAGSARIVTRGLLRRWRRVGKSERWHFAFRFEPEFGDLANLRESHRVESPPGLSWADPFPWSVDGRHFVFVEEYGPELLGRIVVIEVWPDGRWEHLGPAIEESFHMSYPFLIEYRGDIYMIPETRAEHTVRAWRAIQFPMTWQAAGTILTDIDAVDSTIVENDGIFWLFTTLASDLSSTDNLHIFYSTDLFGKWIPHELNPVKIDVTSSRSAGGFLLRDGDLLRPAQDCGPRYGAAIEVNKVTQLSPEAFSELAVARIAPDWDDSLVALHTLNHRQGLTVFDVLVTE